MRPLPGALSSTDHYIADDISAFGCTTGLRFGKPTVHVAGGLDVGNRVIDSVEMWSEGIENRESHSFECRLPIWKGISTELCWYRFVPASF